MTADHIVDGIFTGDDVFIQSGTIGASDCQREGFSVGVQSHGGLNLPGSWRAVGFDR